MKKLGLAIAPALVGLCLGGCGGTSKSKDIDQGNNGSCSSGQDYPSTYSPSSPPPAAPAGHTTPFPDLTQPWPPPPGPAPNGCAVPLQGTHATYNVGPGQAYKDTTDVPWLSLVAGDVVNIYYQPTPYATIIYLRAEGTAANPVIINGVTDKNGNYPEITGEDAVEAADALASKYFSSSAGADLDGAGVFVFYPGPKDGYGYRPQYITLQNLKITGATELNSFTNHSGNKTKFGEFVGGINANVGQNLSFIDNEITLNANGIFVNDKDNSASASNIATQTSYYTTVRGNYIHDNGVAGDDSEHGVYIQGTRTLYEGNYFGQLIPAAVGSSMKDRSSGTVIRYNYIDAAARAIDLVDSENGSNTPNDPLYQMAWVYGNVIVDDCLNGTMPGQCSVDPIHWGGDSENYDTYRNGPLYFYDNTIVTLGSGHYTPIGIFDLATSMQSVYVSNTIITNDSMYPFAMGQNSAGNGTMGTVNIVGTNWLAAGFVDGKVMVSTSGTMLTGDPMLSMTYGLVAGSPAIGAAGDVTFPNMPSLSAASKFAFEYPTAVISSDNLKTTFQYSTIGMTPRPTYVPRKKANDVGAYAAP